MNILCNFQCPVADNEAYRAVHILHVNCKIKLNFYDKAAKSVCLILLCSKNEDSYRNKTFEVYSS